MAGQQKQTAAASTTAATLSFETSSFALPLPYRLFFLFIEPVSALVGAYFAHFGQSDYLKLIHASSTPSTVPLSTSVALSHLANMYLFFAINEALVLRSSSELRVWKTVLFCLLVGDIGHLLTYWVMGPQFYWNVFEWNVMDWGSIPFVYLGASMRISFLADVGLGHKIRTLKKRTA
jgi:hypothetical protein